MSTLKQAFELFWPREIRRSLVENKIEIFSEEATSALVNFHAGPLASGDVGFCGGRKTGEPGEKPSEHGENQQLTHCTGIEPRSHWSEASALTSAYNPCRSLLLKTFPDIIWIPRSPYASSLEGLSVSHRIHCRFVQFDESWPIHFPCITDIFPSIWFGTALSAVLSRGSWRGKMGAGICLF